MKAIGNFIKGIFARIKKCFAMCCECCAGCCCAEQVKPSSGCDCGKDEKNASDTTH